MNKSMRGFTLVEMLIVLGIFGLLLAVSVPAVQRMGRTQSLKGAREDMGAQIQLARARAIAVGDSIPIHFYPNTYGFDYHLHPTGVTPTTGWRLPRGVSYGGSTSLNVTMLNTGRARNSVVIPLVNQHGLRDTLVVLASGLVLGK